jgi:porin
MDESTATKRACVYAWVLIVASIAAPQSVFGEEGLGADDPSRKALAASGLTFGFNHVGEWQANVSGGVSRGGDYIGRLEGVLDLDFARLAGWQGLHFHVNGYQIHGSGLSRDRIANNLMTASYIEALATTRLSELWLDQRFLSDQLGIRFGQLAADTEFNISSYANQFINSTFGWPAIMAANLPSGGPAYPFATPGTRAKFDPDRNVSWLLAVFDGDPAGPGEGDPQTRNRYGVNFRVQDPPLVIGEAQYRYNQEKGSAGLAGSMKLGAWGYFGRSGGDAEAAAGPGGNRDLAELWGHFGIYGVIDQQVWRPATGEADKGVGVFARASASPSDRNPIDLYVDGGIVFAGLIRGRPGDVLSFGAAYARVSSRLRGLDTDLPLITDRASTIPHFEAVLEVNYQAQILPGLQIDLDIQRLVHPADLAAGAAIPDATVLTLHTLIKY